MTDALNQIIHHKREKSPAQLMQAILFLSFLSPYLHRTMLTRFRRLKHNSRAAQDSRISLHKCHSKCCLNVLLKISL